MKEKSFFFQIEGDMVLNIFKNNKIENIKIKEGNIFLLPPKVPHSPQRFENTVGLVIERKRRDNELDGFQWYCDSCNHLLYEKFFKLENIETQLPVIFEKFWSNDEARTCNNCKEYLEKP